MQIKSSYLVDQNSSAKITKTEAITETVDTTLDHSVPIFTVSIVLWLLLLSSTLVLLIAALMITRGLLQHTIITASSLGMSLWPHGLLSYSGAILLMWLFIDGLLTIVVGNLLAAPFSKAAFFSYPTRRS